MRAARGRWATIVAGEEETGEEETGEEETGEEETGEEETGEEETMEVVVKRVASWVGLAGHLCTLPFYLASGLVAPLWAIVVLLALWLALLGVSVWAVRARSPWGLLVPVAAVGLWLGGVSAGEAFLGWTA